MIKQNFKIIVVDDDVSICRVLKAGLETYGFIVRCETCSTDTLHACLEFHPDIVLLDVAMPVKDGGQVASELQNHPTLRHIPLIFLTSLVSKEEATKLNASSTMILSKPILIAQLVAKIRVVLLNKSAYK